MKKLHILLFAFFGLLFATSCSEDDVEYIYENEQNETSFARSQFLQQTGNPIISNNLLTLPIEVFDISHDVHRLDVIIRQNGVQLSGGSWKLFLDNQGFFRTDFTVDEEQTPLISGATYEIDLYMMETSTSTRPLIDTLIID